MSTFHLQVVTPDGCLFDGQAERVVCRTIEGDVCILARHSNYCTALGMGAPVERALVFANHTAALTVCRMGAQPSLPKMAEVLALMRQHGQDTAAFEA